MQIKTGFIKIIKLKMLYAKWEPLNLYLNVFIGCFSSETSIDNYTYTRLKAVQKADFIHWVAYNDMLDFESLNCMVKYVFNAAMYRILVAVSTGIHNL